MASADMRLFLSAAILLSVADKLWAAEICCPGLRCYNNDPPFNDRPLPQCPDDVEITMTLYTRQDRETGQSISRNVIPDSFKDNVLTWFVVHGWNQVRSNPWMYDIKDAALEKGDYNVILVMWRGAMGHFFYDQSASNTRTVGGEIALVSNNTINKKKSSKAMMYCVGASLGGHACGQAGQQGQFRRITGLDPAGPLFKDHERSVGLNPSCADLVDVIHANGELVPTIGAGMLDVLGHIDFYPNGGNSQPGCLLNQYGTVPIVKDIETCNNEIQTCSIAPSVNTLMVFSLGCSHYRAVVYFVESIRGSTPCFLSRYRCSDPNNLTRSCTESKDAVQSMGFYADKYPGRGIFYLKTGACEPFCCQKY